MEIRASGTTMMMTHTHIYIYTYTYVNAYMVVCLNHTVVWFKKFLSNTNNVYTVLWFQIFLRTNYLYI